jgi:hypothetical protein
MPPVTSSAWWDELISFGPSKPLISQTAVATRLDNGGVTRDGIPAFALMCCGSLLSVDVNIVCRLSYYASARIRSTVGPEKDATDQSDPLRGGR